MNQNKITQEDIDHLTWCRRRFRDVHGENLNTDYMMRFYNVIEKLQSNLDSKQDSNNQFNRIEETVNYIKEALQPMESEIEFHIPKEGFVFNPKSVAEAELENNRKGNLQQQLTEGEIKLQELVEKWKAKPGINPKVSEALYSLLSKPICEEEKEALKEMGFSYYPIESKPTLTDVFIQMLQDRQVELFNDFCESFRKGIPFEHIDEYTKVIGILGLGNKSKP
jgi:hypothetical protein